MLSGWGTQGKLVSPYWMEHTKAFRLQHGKKIVGLTHTVGSCLMIIHLGAIKRLSKRTKLKWVDHHLC